MIQETYKPDILVKYWCEDFTCIDNFWDTFCWSLEGNGGGLLEDEEVEKIDKHYEKVKDNLTHEIMIDLLDMTSMRGCNWEVLSEHYIKRKK